MIELQSSPGTAVTFRRTALVGWEPLVIVVLIVIAIGAFFFPALYSAHDWQLWIVFGVSLPALSTIALYFAVTVAGGWVDITGETLTVKRGLLSPVTVPLERIKSARITGRKETYSLCISWDNRSTMISSIPYSLEDLKEFQQTIVRNAALLSHPIETTLTMTITELSNIIVSWILVVFAMIGLIAYFGSIGQLKAHQHRQPVGPAIQQSGRPR